MDLRLARRKTCSTKFQTYIFKNKAALLKKIKKVDSHILVTEQDMKILASSFPPKR